MNLANLREASRLESNLNTVRHRIERFQKLTNIEFFFSGHSSLMQHSVFEDAQTKEKIKNFLLDLLHEEEKSIVEQLIALGVEID